MTSLTPLVSICFITDVCAQDNLAEVQLVSLIEERLPRYVLRADTLTDFAGYDHHDWIQTPCLHLDDNFDLSPELIEETLKYFSKYHMLYSTCIMIRTEVTEVMY